MLPYALLLAVAYLVYAGSFGNTWTYDDFPVIVDNPDVRSWAGFFRDSYPGRPLRELTFLLDHTLFGYQPAGWHLQQVFWHGLNGCLLFALGRKLKLSGWAALIAALLFLLHPLQVEVVANLSHRKDSLALAGSLGALLCYLEFLHLERRRLLWLVAALGCLSLALLAKQTAIVLPILLLLYEMLLVSESRRVLWRYPRIVFCLGGAVAVAAGFWLLKSGLLAGLPASMRDTLAFKANYFDSFSVPIYYLTVLKSWVFMAGKLFWPADLAVEYTFPVPAGIGDPWILAGLAGLTVLLGGLLLWLRRWPLGCWLLSGALLLFIPTSNVWPLVYLAADRYLYAPIAFLSLLAGFGLQWIPAPRRLVTGLSLLVLLLWGGLSYFQVPVWRSPQSLWQQAYRVSPESSFALNNLGNLALQAGRIAEAQNYYRRSVEVNRFNPTAHYNLGMLAEQRRDLRAAMNHYRAFALLNHPAFSQQLRVLREHLQRSYGVQL